MPTPRELAEAAINTLITPMIDHTKHRQANATILNYIDQYLAEAAQNAQSALDAANAAQAAANQASLDAAAAVAAIEEATDILEFDTFAEFPAVGDNTKLYRALTGSEANKIYRWTGAAYEVVGGTGLSGVTAMLAVGNVPNANGATITGNQLQLQPASDTQPGVVTAVAQVIGGVKTFNNNPKLPLGEINGASPIGMAADGSIGKITSTKLTSFLDTFTRNLYGAVPAPGGIVGDNTKVLYEDGVWRVPPGGAASEIEVSATKAAIAGGATKRFVIVNADEDNNGDGSLYVHDGASLRFLLTIPQ